ARGLASLAGREGDIALSLESPGPVALGRHLVIALLRGDQLALAARAAILDPPQAAEHCADQEQPAKNHDEQAHGRNLAIFIEPLGRSEPAKPVLALETKPRFALPRIPPLDHQFISSSASTPIRKSPLRITCPIPSAK